MGPENPIGVELGDPVPVHVCQEISLAVRDKPLVNGLALVGRHWGAIGGTSSGIRGRFRVVLAAERCVRTFPFPRAIHGRSRPTSSRSTAYTCLYA